VTVQPKSRAFGPDPAMLRDFAERLNASRNPAIVAGAGIAREGAIDMAVALAESLNAAVWAAPLWSRTGFPEDHPNFAGFLPAAPGPMHHLLKAHDVILVLGAPAFMLHVSGDLNPLRADLAVLHITDDADSAAATITGRSLLSSIVPALQALTPLLKPIDRNKPIGHARSARLSASDPINAALVMQTIAELRPANSVIVEEAPSHKVAIQNFLPIRRGDDFYSIASGSLGWGLPASVGIALANPQRKVIAVIGDGSMMYSIQALWSAAQLKLPLTIVVTNNGGYGAMRAFSSPNNAPPPGIELAGLDFVALAAGHGVEGVRVASAQQLASALTDAIAADRPRLVEVIVDRAVQKMYTLDQKP
jgi:benzoylformate decarboxylase